MVARVGNRRRQGGHALVDVGAQALVRVDLVGLAEEQERLLLEDTELLRADLVSEHAQGSRAKLEPARFGRTRQAVELPRQRSRSGRPRTESTLPPSSACSSHHSCSVAREYGAGLAGDLGLTGVLTLLLLLEGVLDAATCSSSSSDEMTSTFFALLVDALVALGLGLAAGLAFAAFAFLAGGGETTSTSESLDATWCGVSITS